jgi:TatD DNase family protein
MLVDSHCHLDRLDLSPYENDFSRCVRETLATGVGHMLCVSITLEKYRAMRQLVDPHPEISVSVGVHPNEEHCREPTVDELVELSRDPRVVAIGETGLDYFRSEGDLNWQQDRFRHHIHAAIQAQKPLIIHTREARADTLRILREENAESVGGVLHCFTEDWDTAKAALDMNFYISLSGILTFRNAEQIQSVARQVPDDRLLIETDSPYLAPIPLRGKPNYPAYVRHVAEFLADLRGITVERVAELTTANFIHLFAPLGFNPQNADPYAA